MSHPDSAFSLFEQHYKALVIGASGAIGYAFVEAFNADAHCTHVETLSRSDDEFDVTDEATIREHAERLATVGPFDVIIDATGALTIDGVGPEKSLASLREDLLERNFQINAIGPVLTLKHFAPMLASGPSIYAKLSAHVGSISENTKGGWHGHRAAKAALNMFLQSAAIELQRRNRELRVVALHPGVVRSDLSSVFSGSIAHVLEPHESVAGLLQTLKSLTPKAGAHYVDYTGQAIGW